MPGIWPSLIIILSLIPGVKLFFPYRLTSFAASASPKKNNLSSSQTRLSLLFSGEPLPATGKTDKASQVEHKPSPAVWRIPQHGRIIHKHPGALEMIAVERTVQFLQALQGKTLGHEQEMHAIHAAPVLLEVAVFTDRSIDRRPWKRGELGQIKIIHRQREQELPGFFHAGLCFSRHSNHQQPFDPDTVFLDQPYALGQLLQIHFPVQGMQHVLIPAFNSQADHPAACIF